MDMTSIIVGIGTFILGLAAVKAFLAKILPQAVKYSGIAKDAITLIEHVLAALKDGQISQPEVDQINADVAELKAALAK